MKNAVIKELATELSSLAVFRQILSDPVISSLVKFLELPETATKDEAVAAYSSFVCELYEKGDADLTGHIKELCYNCENVYIRTIGKGGDVSPYIVDSTVRELRILGKLASLPASALYDTIGWQGELPSYSSEKCDLLAKYRHRTENIGKYGYGKYARYRMFTIDEDGTILPVQNADKTRLCDLIEYENERKLLIDNTKALLDGKPAANVLLTGDAGTGKSSTIKAIGNEFFSDGLRIIEVRKEQLATIPLILDELAENPLKFILFIDDLSFQSDDDNFNALKAVLEGSVSARSRNVAVYATSNRRHIVRECFSDRDGDEIHRNDTMQETISLSARFGLHITFQKPSKQTYLHIVHVLAGQNGIDLPEQELDLGAEQFALERGGRSARLAKQYVDKLITKKNP